jgi:aminoglycoside phosphotransferase
MRPGQITGHQDAGPYNAVVDGDRLVGFYDCDIAGPSSREWDLAFSALPWVLLASPNGDTPSGSHDIEERSR